MKMLMTTTFAILVIRIDAGLSVVPENATVAVGTRVTLKCSTISTQPVVWKIHRNVSVANIIFTGTKITNNFAELYKISKPKQGTFNLEFIVSKETAAVYSCEEAGGTPVYAELKVFDSGRPPNYSSTWTNNAGVSDGETGESSSKVTLTTVTTCLVLLVIVVIALSGYVINIKRRNSNASAVGLSNCPTRESAAPSDYVELPTREGKCKRFTASGDYSALRAEQYAQLEVYAVLDTETEKF